MTVIIMIGMMILVTMITIEIIDTNIKKRGEWRTPWTSLNHTSAGPQKRLQPLRLTWVLAAAPELPDGPAARMWAKISGERTSLRLFVAGNWEKILRMMMANAKTKGWDMIHFIFRLGHVRKLRNCGTVHALKNFNKCLAQMGNETTMALTSSDKFRRLGSFQAWISQPETATETHLRVLEQRCCSFCWHVCPPLSFLEALKFI